MGVCLSCHRRKRRGSEKKKADLQLCQSLAPLHDCVGQCNKVSDRNSVSVSGDSGDKNPVNRASVACPAACDHRSQGCVTKVYSVKSSAVDRPGELYSGSDNTDNSVCNGTRKRTVSSYKENLDSFNKFYTNDNSNGKRALSLLNGHHLVSISNKKDNSCNSKCDNFSTDLINVKTCSGDSATMANTISNMKMTNPIKGLVSKRRKRYTEGGFNLDLTYITHNIIAMGFPAKNVEAMYRNDIDDVARFLEDKHKDHYKIYNLCSERSYDSNKFQKRVSVYPFDDHNPPKIDLIRSFCEDVHTWLSANQRNVAAVHCKAGKGRTGTMICCYLLHIGQFKAAADALNFYGQKRTHNRKGVTIPSQRRYVEYYAALLGMLDQEEGMAVNEGTEGPASPMGFYRPPALLILELLMKPPPALNGGQSTLEFCVSEANHPSQKISLGCHEVRKGSSHISMRLDRCTPLVGDIKVEVYNKPKKEKLFHFWFNTFFVTHQVNAVREDTVDQGTLITMFRLTLDKWQLDDAHKDKRNKIYTQDFMVQLLVQRVPENSAWGCGGTGRLRGSPPSLSHSSSAEEDDSEDSLEPEEGWDSAVVEREGAGAALLGRYRLLSEPDLELDPSGQQQRPDVDRMLQA